MTWVLTKQQAEHLLGRRMSDEEWWEYVRAHSGAVDVPPHERAERRPHETGERRGI